MRTIVAIIVLCMTLSLSGCHLLSVSSDKDLACADLHATEQKELCLHSYAKEYDRIEPCHRITDDALQRSCYRQVAQKRDYRLECSRIRDNATRDKCYFMKTRHSPEERYCAKIDSPSRQNNCYVFLAREYDNASYCSKADALEGACISRVKNESI